MAKSTHAEMLKYGQWLASILKKEINGWEYKTAMQNAHDILGISNSSNDLEISDPPGPINNFVLEVLSEIADTKMDAAYHAMISHRSDWLKQCDAQEISMDESFGDRDERNVRSKYVMLVQENYLSNKGKIDSFIEGVAKEFDDIEERAFFREQVDYAITKSPFTKSVLRDHELNLCETLDRFWLLREEVVRCLQETNGVTMPEHYRIQKLDFRDDCITSYNNLQESLRYTSAGFVDELTYTKSSYYGYQPDVLIARFFIEFLRYGGGNYYGFCEYCGNFYVTERKGRKKFCSDICRTNNQRK